jgi:hypothetical protein
VDLLKRIDMACAKKVAMLSHSTRQSAEAVTHAGLSWLWAVAAHRSAAARPASSAGMPESRHHTAQAVIRGLEGLGIKEGGFRL